MNHAELHQAAHGHLLLHFTRHQAAIELAQRLAELMPGDLNHASFTSGGSESVEAAWKIVREHFEAIGQPQRRKAIARNIAYHGC